MLDADIIEISHSAWSAPVVLILKPDGTWRFCVDYRGLNEVTVRNVYPLPRISDILSKLQGAEFFSIMDLQSGYHQLPLRKENREKTAFVTPDGLYQFKVLPFGLANGSSTFQSSMDIILGGLRWTSCLVYLDGIIVYYFGYIYVFGPYFFLPFTTPQSGVILFVKIRIEAKNLQMQICYD